MSVSYAITGSNDDPKQRISITLDGRFRSFLRRSTQGEKLLEALKNGAPIDDIRLISSIDAWVAQQTFGRVSLDDRDQLRLGDRIVDYGLAQLIKRMVDEGFDVIPLTNFIERVDRNPNKGIADDLYRFLEKGCLPITPEGRFRAFKRVGESFRSFGTGREKTFTVLQGQTTCNTPHAFYPIGAEVYMNRDDCDENRNQTCSRGLHACSFEYLHMFHGGSGKIILVEIDPENVTAIPTDYNEAKLRCCSLTVISEIPEADAREYFQNVVDHRHPAKVEEHSTDWFALGRESGNNNGRQDGENGWEYDPSPDFPNDILSDKSRQQFSQGYFQAYPQAFSESVVENYEEETDLASYSLDDTVRIASSDAVKNAANDYAIGVMEAIPLNGEYFEDFVGTNFQETYKLAYITTYARYFIDRNN